MTLAEWMTTDVLTVTPDRTLAETARHLIERNCGSAVVIDTEAAGPGIITERDLVRAMADGRDPDREVVRDHVTMEARFADGDWSVERAAEAMIEGGFRHLVILGGGEPTGVVSMRDIVRRWLDRG